MSTMQEVVGRAMGDIVLLRKLVNFDPKESLEGVLADYNLSLNEGDRDDLLNLIQTGRIELTGKELIGLFDSITGHPTIRPVTPPPPPWRM
jgi:hypothetical protein